MDYRNDILEEDLKAERLNLEQGPVDTLEMLTMETELTRRHDDIEKVKSYIVERDQLVQVISYAEERAQARNISIEVPAINERILIDPATGVEIPPSGIFQDLEIDLQATGNPDNIVDFLYDLEHSPYLLQLQSWNVSQDTILKGVPVGSSAAPEDSEEIEQIEGSATITAIVTIWRGKEKSE